MAHMSHSTNWASNDVGRKCWISDPAQAYIEAEVTAVRDGHVIAVSTDGRSFDIDLEEPLKPPTRKQKEPPRRILQRTPLTTINGVENMDSLDSLHEASILDNIENRFRMDQIYTNTGPILIAMNPFKWLPIYGDDVINRYNGRPYGSLPPHCFQESEDAFQQLDKTGKNQAIVICGESGAGKTETTKLMLYYLAVVSRRAAERQNKRPSYEGASPASSRLSYENGKPLPTIAERMVNSNPLLEAYGNAKTLRNNNSSRFGKFTRYDFARNSCVIAGGHIENLLLEKVRVVEQGSGERNYHIFYQIVAAAKKGLLGENPARSTELANALGFATPEARDPSKHSYTKVCSAVEGMDDCEEYEAMIKALEAIGVPRGSAIEQTILEVTVAVYLTGDVHFETVEGVGGDDSSKVTANSRGALEKVASLLGVADATKLGEALCCRVRELRERGSAQKVTTLNNARQSVDLRDAMAKAVYSHLFDWLVHRANGVFDKSGHEARFIGVLDIFGFEDMAVNGFEQVFINTTNEQLQKVFNDIVFKAEEEEYAREQIEWDKTTFPDNSPCIELLTKRPTGILRILDAECLRGNAASDGAKLAAKLNKAHGSHQFFEVCGPASVWRRNSGERTHDEDFQIHHYAGPIVYTVEKFVDKNRDSLYAHVHDVLAESKLEVVQELFPKREIAVEEAGQPGAAQQKENTVANKYLGQLTALVGVLRESSTRFVRCIKTNTDKVPAKLDKPAALKQLVCGGVMAALEVRRAGFPTRVLYRDFVREFRAFTPRGAKGVGNDLKAMAAKMMAHPHVVERLGTGAHRLGVSKVFLRAETLYVLESVKNSMLFPFVRRLQRWWIRMQGSIIQRKYKRCVADLSDAQSEASVKAVAFVHYVAEALTECEGFNQAAFKAVAKLAATQSETGPAAIAAIELIEDLRGAVNNAQKVVAHAVAAKERAYKERAELLSEIDAATSRCDALKTVANELYDPSDSKQLLASTKVAEDALSACRNELLLTVASQWDSATLHHYHNKLSLSEGGSTDSPRTIKRQGSTQRRQIDQQSSVLTAEQAQKQRRERLDAAHKLVRAAEASSMSMLDKKRAMEEARQEFQGSLDLASDRLSAIQVDVFIIAGITTVSNAVARARDAIFAAQKALQAVDPDPCKSAVAAATSAVENALVVAQREAARVSSMVTLDESERTLTEITYQATATDIVSTSLKDACAIAEDLVTTARSACQYPDIEVLRTSTQRAVDAVNGCGELLERLQAKKRADEKARFNKLLGRFQKMDDESRSIPKFARKSGNTNKPLFKVKRVSTEENENVSGVGPRSSYVISAQQAETAPLNQNFSPPPAVKKKLSVTRPEVSSSPMSTSAASVATPSSSTYFPPTPEEEHFPATVNPPPPASSSSKKATSLDAWIASKNLEKYSKQIHEIAGDCSDLLEMTDDDAAELIELCKMPKLAARRLRKSLIELGATIAP